MAEVPASSVIVVRLPTELDLASPAGIWNVMMAAVEKHAVVIADLTTTFFCDSSGLRQLLLAHEHARARHSILRVALDPASPVARSLKICGLHRVLFLYHSVEDALRVPSSHAGPG